MALDPNTWTLKTREAVNAALGPRRSTQRGSHPGSPPGRAAASGGRGRAAGHPEARAEPVDLRDAADGR